MNKLIFAPVTLALGLLVACGGAPSTQTASTQPAAPAPQVTVALQSYGSLYDQARDYSTVARGSQGSLIAAWNVLDGVTGSVDHGIGSVTSGQPFSTPPLVDSETTFTLTLTGRDGKTATSKITIKATDGPIFSLLRKVEGSANQTYTVPAGSGWPYATSWTYGGGHYAPVNGSKSVSYIEYEGVYDTAVLTTPDGASAATFTDTYTGRATGGGLDYTSAAEGFFYASAGSTTPTQVPFDRKGTWTLTLTRNGISETRTITR